jgi:alkylphosphonate utilization operon protein PhnA
MSGLPNCPQCGSQFTYEDGAMLVCPECAHEWSAQAEAAGEEQGREVRDANGNLLQDGDTVTVIKDLKVKGSHWWSRWVPRLRTSAWWMVITISIARSMASVPWV